MTTTEYVIGVPILQPDRINVKARFRSLEDAIIFMKAYMAEYDQEPNLELSLIRRDRIVDDQ